MAEYLDRARAFAHAARAQARTVAHSLRAALPFSGAPQGSPNIPAIDWSRVGPAPIPPGGAPFAPGFSDYTFSPSGAPLSFDGFTLERLRASASLHRQGLFLESSLAAVALMSFGPALAAWEQRCAPAISLERKISAEGARGLARICAEEVEAMLCPRDGLLPSECFPPENFGAIESGLALFRFAVLQHVDGEPDPDTGVRLRYTRPWPVWAVQYYRESQKWVALTKNGIVEIDGTHFTLVSDIPEPHLASPILALMEQAFSGRQTEQFRNAWIRAFGSPKLVGTLPPKVPTDGEQGRAFYNAVLSILGPGGFGILPNEAKMSTIGLSGEASGSFKEALDDVIAIIGMILVGSSGLLDKGAGGVYTSPVYEGVAMRLISRDIVARDRAVNGGHVLPFIRGNYGADVDKAKARGIWIDPVLRTPLPDLAAEKRYESAAKQQAAYYASLKSEREAGGDVTQDRAQALALQHGATPMTLAAKPAGAASFAYDQENGIITRNQRLEELGKPLDPSPQGDMTVPKYRAWLAAEVEREKAQAQANAEIKVDDAAPDAPPKDAAA